MTPEQKIGLGALILIGAVVVGYLVSCIVPAQHYPRIAGVLAANAIIAGLAVAGIEPAAHIVFWFGIASVYALLIAGEADGIDL